VKGGMRRRRGDLARNRELSSSQHWALDLPKGRKGWATTDKDEGEGEHGSWGGTGEGGELAAGAWGGAGVAEEVVEGEPREREAEHGHIHANSQFSFVSKTC
jgi:hypothetical protein